MSEKQISLGIVDLNYKPKGESTFTALGYTHESENAKLNIKREYVEHKVNELSGAYERRLKQINATVTVSFLKDDNLLELLTNDVVKNTDGTVDIIDIPGTEAVEGILHIHPISEGSNTKYDVSCWRAIPEVEEDEDYKIDGKAAIKVVFHCTAALDGANKGHVIKRGAAMDGSVNII